LPTEAGLPARFQECEVKGALMPIDPTPQGGEVTRKTPEPEYPEPKPQGADRTRNGEAGADRDERGAPSDRPREDPLTGAGEDIAG
jgi:hypothetical protein